MKFVIAFLLLLTAVPAGCLPLMSAGAVVDEVRASRHKSATRSQTGARATYAAAAVMAALAVASGLAFSRMLRRASRLEEHEDWLGLGRSAWRMLLWTSFVLGAACGVSMIVMITGV